MRQIAYALRMARADTESRLSHHTRATRAAMQQLMPKKVQNKFRKIVQSAAITAQGVGARAAVASISIK